MSPSPRVLLIAYACAPNHGSEWGLSWNFARELARTQPVWVIAHAENRAETEEYLAAHPPEHPIHVEYVTLPGWVNWLSHLRYVLFNVQYCLWRFAAARTARRMHAVMPFDIVHHVSLVRWWMPSAGATLATRGAMFVFGPVGGGEQMPRKFRANLSLSARLTEMVRGVAVALWGLDPGLRRCVKLSALALADTPQAADRLARYHPTQLETMSSAVTSDPAILAQARAIRAARPAGQRFRIMSSGGLSYYRGVDLCLRAFAKSGLVDAEYLHASDGADRSRLEALASSLGLDGRMRFLGDQPHAENVKAIATADVYVHVVLRDSHGLIPDALALGIPVLTLDHNSMSLLVDATSGHKIPIDANTTPELVIDELARVMKEWHDDPALRERLGRAGIARSERFTPSGRAAIFKAIYARLMAAQCAPIKAALTTTPPYPAERVRA